MTDAAIDMGDVVEHKMNTDVFGIVIGFMGSLVGIRTSPGLLTHWFHKWELRLVDDDEYRGPQDGEVAVNNVVNFTEARELRANTKTRGVA